MSLRLDLPRAERASEVARLRALGLTQQQVADRLGISRSYVSELCVDPDGSQVRARKDSYRGTCETCGKQTDGSNGRARTPKLCLECATSARAAVCGTRSKYTAGCRCEPCTAANREAGRALRHAGRTPPTHGASGYSNYGCRCDVCTRANTEASYGYGWRYERNKRRAAA